MKQDDPTSPGLHARPSTDFGVSISRASSRSVAIGSPGITMDRRSGTGAIRIVLMVAVGVVTVAVAAAWSLVVRRQLVASAQAETVQHLDRAHRVFELVRVRTQDHLRAQCRVLVEDPRLKTTLAVEGMDEATVADILGDLGKQRGTGFLMVLSPEGRVFAQAGAEELRGLDLSGSSVVKAAQASPEAVIGSWVIGGKVLDLSIKAVRYGQNLMGYLAVGQAVDEELVKAVAAQTGVAVASATGSRVVLASSSDAETSAVFAAAAAQAGVFDDRVLEVAGATYVSAVHTFEHAPQSEQRLVFTRPVASVESSFAPLSWMVLIPPVLVLIAVLFAMAASPRTLIVTRPRRTE